MNIERLSVGAKLALLIAKEEAKQASHQYVEKEHIFIGICSLEKGIYITAFATMSDPERKALKEECVPLEYVLIRFGVDTTQLRRLVRERLGEGNFNHTGNEVPISEACSELFSRADRLSTPGGKISCLHLFAAILEEPGDIISSVLLKEGINTNDLREKVLACAGAAEEKQKDTLIEILEKLVKVDEKLTSIVEGRIGKGQGISPSLNPGKGFLTTDVGYIREKMRYLLRSLSDIRSTLGRGFIVQAAIALVEIIFVFYYALGIWHYIIEERWKDISPLDKLIVGALFAAFVPRGVHLILEEKRWKFGIGIGLLMASLGIIVYAVIVTSSVYKM